MKLHGIDPIQAQIEGSAFMIGGNFQKDAIDGSSSAGFCLHLSCTEHLNEFGAVLTTVTGGASFNLVGVQDHALDSKRLTERTGLGFASPPRVTHPSEMRNPSESADIEKIVRDALSGNRAAQRKLIVEFLSPVVQARTAKVLLRRSEGKSRVRNEMMDLCQQVFVHLFSNNLLARWEPSQGQLGAFVGIVTENYVRSVLRSRVRSPFTEVATEDEALEVALGDRERHEETALLSRHVLRRLNAELSDSDREDFYAFFVDERSIEEMCLLRSKSREAVYKQRQRLKEKIRRILEDEAASSRTGADARPKEEAP